MITQIKDEVARLHELALAIQNYHPNTADHDALDEYEDAFSELDDAYDEVSNILSDLMEQIDPDLDDD